MTWSIIAQRQRTGQFGIAVATKFFAVGARVPHIAAGVGAVATQALVNPLLRHRRPAAAARGRAPARHRRRADSRPMTAASSRQLHVMDARWPDRRPYRRAIASTGAGMSPATTSRLPATCWRARRARRDRASLRRERSDLPFARRLIAAHAGGRGGRRRQARQAIGGAADPRQGGLVRARPARRRPCRSACRARAARTRSAASAGCISGSSCRRGRTRPASPIARRSTPASPGRAARAMHDRSPLIDIERPARAVPRRRRPHHACGRRRRPLASRKARRSASSANPAAARA